MAAQSPRPQSARPGSSRQTADQRHPNPAVNAGRRQVIRPTSGQATGQQRGTSQTQPGRQVQPGHQAQSMRQVQPTRQAQSGNQSRSRRRVQRAQVVDTPVGRVTTDSAETTRLMASRGDIRRASHPQGSEPWTATAQSHATGDMARVEGADRSPTTQVIGRGDPSHTGRQEAGGRAFRQQRSQGRTVQADGRSQRAVPGNAGGSTRRAAGGLRAKAIGFGRTILTGVMGLTGRIGMKSPSQLGAVILAVVAVIALAYGAVIQSRQVSRAQALNGALARVVTAVVLDQGFGGTTVDLHGSQLTIGSLQSPVPVGHPIRVRLNPSTPSYGVDARFEVNDVVAKAKRARLVIIVLAILGLIGAGYWYRRSRNALFR